MVLAALALIGCQLSDCRLKPAVQFDDGSNTPADIQGDRRVYHMNLQCDYRIM